MSAFENLVGAVHEREALVCDSRPGDHSGRRLFAGNRRHADAIIAHATKVICADGRGVAWARSNPDIVVQLTLDQALGWLKIFAAALAFILPVGSLALLVAYIVPIVVDVIEELESQGLCGAEAGDGRTLSAQADEFLKGGAG